MNVFVQMYISVYMFVQMYIFVHVFVHHMHRCMWLVCCYFHRNWYHFCTALRIRQAGKNLWKSSLYTNVEKIDRKLNSVYLGVLFCFIQYFICVLFCSKFWVNIRVCYIVAKYIFPSFIYKCGEANQSHNAEELNTSLMIFTQKRTKCVFKHEESFIHYPLSKTKRNSPSGIIMFWQF